MKKQDGRTLDHITLEWIRKTAVKRVVEGKESPKKVMEGFGLAEKAIFPWIRKFKKGGYKALTSTKGTGRPRVLTKIEEKKIDRLLLKNPRQLHFDFGLWTLQMVKELVLREFKKSLSLTGISRMLERIGFTKQKPLYRAYQQNPEAVEKWMREEYPTIAKEAKKEKRTIFFEDEAGFRSDHHSGTTWAKKGKTPIVKTTGARFGCNCISAISKKGALKFMLYDVSFTNDVFIQFLERFLEGNKEKFTIVADGHPVHKSQAVKKWIKEKSEGRIKLYILPSYSPERNPDEQVWKHTKGFVERKMIGGPKQFKANIRSHLHKLQKLPSLIQGFFRHPEVSYIS